MAPEGAALAAAVVALSAFSPVGCAEGGAPLGVPVGPTDARAGAVVDTAAGVEQATIAMHSVITARQRLNAARPSAHMSPSSSPRIHFHTGAAQACVAYADGRRAGRA